MKNDIGVIAFTKYSVEGKERDIYLPLNISQQKEPGKNQNYKIALLPGKELSEVYVTIQQLKEDGKPGNFIKKGEKLDYGYYPADRTVEIPISGLKEKGIYYMEFGATLRSGGTYTIETWFYNP